MNWWRRGFEKSGGSDRVVPMPHVDVTPVSKMPTAPIRPLNESDKHTIKKLEETFTKAGVLGEKAETIDVAARIDDVLEKVAEQGSRNVEELVGDPTFNRQQFGHANGENFLITEVDDDEFVTYDLYNPNEGQHEDLEIEEGDDGSISFRLEDGTVLRGTRPTTE